MKLFLEQEGILLKTYGESFKEAYQPGLHNNEEQSFKMIDGRNISVRLHDRLLSQEVLQ